MDNILKYDNDVKFLSASDKLNPEKYHKLTEDFNGNKYDYPILWSVYKTSSDIDTFTIKAIPSPNKRHNYFVKLK